jgi:hypothetical protein
MRTDRTAAEGEGACLKVFPSSCGSWMPLVRPPLVLPLLLLRVLVPLLRVVLAARARIPRRRKRRRMVRWQAWAASQTKTRKSLLHPAAVGRQQQLGYPRRLVPAQRVARATSREVRRRFPQPPKTRPARRFRLRLRMRLGPRPFAVDGPATKSSMQCAKVSVCVNFL